MLWSFQFSFGFCLIYCVSSGFLMWSVRFKMAEKLWQDGGLRSDNESFRQQFAPKYPLYTFSLSLSLSLQPFFAVLSRVLSLSLFPTVRMSINYLYKHLYISNNTSLVTLRLFISRYFLFYVRINGIWIFSSDILVLDQDTKW